MKPIAHALLFAAAALPAQAVLANCYSIYRSNQMIFSSTAPPVDMSQPLGETVPRKFGAGAVLIFQPDSIDCPIFDLRVGAPSPVLDDSGGRAAQRKRAAPADLTPYFNGPEYRAPAGTHADTTARTGAAPARTTR